MNLRTDIPPPMDWGTADDPNRYGRYGRPVHGAVDAEVAELEIGPRAVAWMDWEETIWVRRDPLRLQQAMSQSWTGTS